MNVLNHDGLFWSALSDTGSSVSSNTYGEKQLSKRKDEVAEEARERVNNRFDEAYGSYAEGGYDFATEHALHLFFALDRWPYSVGRFVKQIEKMDLDIAQYNMRDEPVHTNLRQWSFHLTKLVGAFEAVADEFGFGLSGGVVEDPAGVLGWFSRAEDCDVGACVWGDLADQSPAPFEAKDVVLSSLNFLEALAVESGILEDDTKPSYRLEEDFEDSWLYGEYTDRVAIGQDLVTVISAAGERGVGKTVLALKLAQKFDRTERGVTAENVTVHPEELRQKYLELPPGSALVLDEAEAGLSNRSAMTNANKAIRDLMNMGRVEEKYLFIVAPAADHLDKFAEQLSAAWILGDGLGEAWVHEFQYNPYEGNVMTPKHERLRWWDLQGGDLQDAHNAITDMKRAKLRGEEGSDSLMQKGDVDEKLKQARKRAATDTRNDLLGELYQNEDLGLTQQQLADAVDLSRSRVADILTK